MVKRAAQWPCGQTQQRTGAPDCVRRSSHSSWVRQSGGLGMARETGLEPAASAVTGRRSNQLSYSRIPKSREGCSRSRNRYYVTTSGTSRLSWAGPGGVWCDRRHRAAPAPHILSSPDFGPRTQPSAGSHDCVGARPSVQTFARRKTHGTLFRSGRAASRDPTFIVRCQSVGSCPKALPDLPLAFFIRLPESRRHPPPSRESDSGTKWKAKK
jgi:hypothetical protein